MRAELGRVETDARHPLLDEPRVLPRGQTALGIVFATGEQKLAWLASGQPQVFVDGHAGLVRQFEPHGTAGLLLPDCRAVHRVTAWGHVVDADGDNVTAAQFAVDRQVEQREIALLALDLELRSDRPDVARFQRWLGADELPFIPRHSSGHND